MHVHQSLVGLPDTRVIAMSDQTPLPPEIVAAARQARERTDRAYKELLDQREKAADVMRSGPTLVDGAAISTEASDGVVTITVETYEELRELRIVVDGHRWSGLRTRHTPDPCPDEWDTDDD